MKVDTKTTGDGTLESPQIPTAVVELGLTDWTYDPAAEELTVTETKNVDKVSKSIKWNAKVKPSKPDGKAASTL